MLDVDANMKALVKDIVASEFFNNDPDLSMPTRLPIHTEDYGQKVRTFVLPEKFTLLRYLINGEYFIQLVL